MTGNAWLCLTLADYNLTIPSEVASYYEVAEATTWAQLNEQILSKKYKLQRGPYTVSGIQVMFVNLDVDYTTAMATAIQGLQTTVPFGYLLSEAQVRSYMGQQWYVGTLQQVVAYNNKVGTGQGLQVGENKWADAIENDSNPGEWAILKHPSYEDSVMTLIQGDLPQGWLPDVEPI
jgi:hypothetical protein